MSDQSNQASQANQGAPAAPAPQQHGLAPTPEISAKDNAGAFKAAPPAQQQPTNDPTQNGKTLPIGGADGGQGNVYKPAGLPDHLIGQSDKETIDRLSAAYTGARGELAKGKPAIPKAEEYQFNWSDQLKGTIGKDDPALKEFATVAHEHGFTQQQIDAIPKFMDKLVEKGLIEKPFEAGKLLEELAPEGFRGTPEQRQAKGGERLAAAEAWIAQLDAKAHGIDDGMKQELRLLTTSLPGVRLVEMFARGGMNISANPGGGQQPGGITKETVEARVADPRNDSQGPKFDPAFAEETKRQFRALYGA